MCKDDETSDHPLFYKMLSNHQQQEEWEGQVAATALHRWTDYFIRKFKLDIPQVVIRLDNLPFSQLGSFKGDHNGFGLQYEVAMNPIYLNPKRPRWEPFATLLHQLLHAWQFSRGIDHPTYVHDSEYRKKAAALGLAVNLKGITGCIPGGPFQYLLGTHGIIVAPDVILADGCPKARFPTVCKSNAGKTLRSGLMARQSFANIHADVRVFAWQNEHSVPSVYYADMSFFKLNRPAVS